MIVSEDSDESGEGSVRAVILGLCAMAAVLSIALAGYLFSNIGEQVSALEDVQTDNRTWNLAQVEVELLRLQLAAQEVLLGTDREDPPVVAQALAEFRLRFDIVYSRHTIMSGAIRNGRFADIPNSMTMLTAQSEFLDQTVLLVDGPDPDLIAAMPVLESRIESIRALVRPIIMGGLGSLILEGSQARTNLETTFRDFAVAVLALTVLMAVMIVIALQQTLASRRRLMTSQRMRHNLNLMIQASLDAVLIVDDMGRITLHNHAAAIILAPGGRMLNGVSFHDLVDNDAEKRLRRRADFAAIVGKGRFDLQARSLDGRHFPAEIAITEAQASTEVPVYIVFMRDMTDVVEREQRLTEASIAARRGEEAKARFLAVMSHEMRTPLNGVLATIDLLKPMCNQNDRAANYLGIIQRSGQAALDQVNNVLEMARIDATDGNAYPEVDFSPALHLRDLAEQMSASARTAGNRLEVEIAPALRDTWVRGRLTLLTRVIYNLLGNAVKFTSDGVVTLRLAPAPAGDGEVGMEISVIDSGIGIAPEDIERIFRTFETLDSSYARMRDGSGLGLGIAKLAAETLGGAISVQSTPGKGSTFTLTVALPRAQPRQPVEVAEPAAPVALRPLNILIAEDNPINSEVLAELLTADGHSVAQARNGNDAVEMACDDAFDAILMDINMPGCDGIEATRRLRAAGVETPVFAATAMAGTDEIATFRAAGMCDVLTKPISRSRLRDLLRVAEACRGGGHCKIAGGTCPGRDSMAGPLIDDEVRADLSETLGPEAVARFTTRFMAELEQTQAELHRLCATSSCADAARLAHKTAGSAAAVGFVRVNRILKDMQKAGEAGDSETMHRLLGRLDAARQDLEQTLAAGAQA